MKLSRNKKRLNSASKPKAVYLVKECVTMRLEEKLTALRREHKMTQAELAEALDVSRQAVSKWERGIASPSMENLVCMGRLFGVPVEQLVDESLALQKKPVEMAAVAEPQTQPERRGLRAALAIALAACLLLSAIASVITIVSAIGNLPKKPDALRQKNLTYEHIDLTQVEPWDENIQPDQINIITKIFGQNIAGYSISAVSPLFSLERGDFVILRYSYSFLFPSRPPKASLDLGLLDSSGRFFSINVDVEGGRISQTIEINETESYVVAVRNNSSKMVCVSGHLDVWQPAS